MKPIVCVYCEGNDAKIAVFISINKQLKILKAASLDLLASTSSGADFGVEPTTVVEPEAGLKLEGVDVGSITGESSGVLNAQINAELQGIKLENCLFLPILTEPSIYYQVFSKKATSENSLTKEILKDVDQVRDQNLDKNTFGVIELSDGGNLIAYLSQDVACLKMIDGLARYNNRRFYKIAKIKSAEISLANLIIKKKKFFPDDHSLVVYVGKEYSKLIFLHGRKLKHIGTTLDVGTSNLHTYDVYFSKILLEMENGGIPGLDNIVVAGEDVSENLILSFYGIFPEANVSRLEFDHLDVSPLSEETRTAISSFSVPIAVAYEHYEELIKEYKGINLLPKYIVEEQKTFQFGWHAFLVLPLIFGVAFYFTFQILTNQATIGKLNEEIAVQADLKRQNMEIISQIEALDVKINAFDLTQRTLDSITVGTEVWGSILEKVSDYMGIRKAMWIRNFTINDVKEASLDGQSLNKYILTDFTSRINDAILKNVNYEPIRDNDAYRFTVTFKLPESIKDTLKK